MSLNNVDSSNGYLECVGTDGYAVSEPQESPDNNFSSVQNIEGKFEFANINNTNSILTYETDDSNSIASSEYNTSTAAWYAFDGDTGMYWHSNGTNGVEDWISRDIGSNVILNKISFMHGGVNSDYDRTWKKIEISGSPDGTTWTVIHVESNITGWVEGEYINIFIPNNTTEYSHYMFKALERNGTDNYSYVLEILMYKQSSTVNTLVTNELIQDGDALVLIKDDDSIHEMVANGVTGSGPYEMDTTVITGGEVPSRAYRVDEGVLFNNVEATGSGDTYSGTDPLLSTRTFDDVEITGTSCETKVQMSATGNKMIELSFDLWKES